MVGKDFPKRHIGLLAGRGIGTQGLEVKDGKTFKWKAKYECDLNAANTLSTHLNVFKDFKPRIPEALRSSRHLFLANIDPSLQGDVLGQLVRPPRLIACDTMNFWIENKPKELRKLLRRVDLFLLNDSEAKQLSGESNLGKAARAILSFGPTIVVIKKGEHGVILFSKSFKFLAPAFLLDSIRDPTGAGDTFAGGMIGYLSSVKSINNSSVKNSVIYGTILASFCVERFSVNRLASLGLSEIRSRYREFEKLTRF